MFGSTADNRDRVRQAFAEQFEPDHTGYVYRRSQKGEAIRVSTDERRRFIDEFDRRIRRARWIIYIGLTLAVGAPMLWSLQHDAELTQPAIFAGLGAAMICYFSYHYRAWTAPARELAGRTPIARERSPEEVRRLRFQRLTYRQLVGAAFAGLVIPFLGASPHDLFSGWNRLWLAFGAVITLVAAVQAFRKWRFKQDESYRKVIHPLSTSEIASDDDSGWPAKDRLWRYLPLALLLLGLALIGFTRAGKRLAQAPAFLPIVMIGVGTWAMFTVAQGLRKGRIEPFVRGFYNTYEREAQPMRFWASVAWNGIFGCLFIWLAFQTIQMRPQGETQTLRDRCYNASNHYSPPEVVSACDQLFNSSAAAIQARPDDADAYFNRGFAYERRGDLKHAIADFSEVIRLRPDHVGAYYLRWAAYTDLGDDERAAADLAALDRIDPKVAATLRGNR